MSRNVPMDRTLSNEDRRYVRGLGAFGQHLEKRLDTEFPPSAEALAEFEREHRKYLAKMNGTGHTVDEQNALLDENAALRARIAELEAAASQPPTDEPTSNVPSYTGWTKAQLEAEIDRVNAEDAEAKLAKGKVVEMVEALTAYFTE